MLHRVAAGLNLPMVGAAQTKVTAAVVVAETMAPEAWEDLKITVVVQQAYKA